MTQLEDILTPDRHDRFITAVSGDSKSKEKEAILELTHLIKDFVEDFKREKKWNKFQIKVYPGMYAYHGDYAVKDENGKDKWIRDMRSLEVGFDVAGVTTGESLSIRKCQDVWHTFDHLFDDYKDENDFWTFSIQFSVYCAMGIDD